MNRRDFLSAASASMLPVMLDGFGLKAMSRQSALVQSLLQTSALSTDRVLVMVYLNGGNDGLNTVLPLDQLSVYNGLRSNIALPQNRILALDGNPATGFHPAMSGMRNLYNEGKLTIVHSVSYPNPDLSHARSTDIWMTGVDASQTSTSGWAGRYLDNRFPDYPNGYPNPLMDDPLAIQIGYVTSTALLGSQQSMAIALNDPDNFYALVGINDPVSPPETVPGDAGALLSFIRKQQNLAVGYAEKIKAAADAGKNLAAYPEPNAGNSLAEQLKIVARLIHGGLKTKVYYVSMNGFDTHSAQVDPTDTTKGEHATLLSKLSAALASFQRDLEMQETANRVIGMTFSEFGRRANANASAGTDHGVAAPMFVFGTGVKHQTIGTNPDLSNLTGMYGNKDIGMQIDFRRVYSDILTDWFGVDRTTTGSLLFREFPTVSLFSNTIETIASGNWQDRSVWTIGRVPMASEYVKINAGHTLTVDRTITVKNIRLAGKLNFTGPYSIRMTG
ncbi:DUF1501 domain-containing protein [Spirosoma fluviale]|uniref:Uncharacterized conserved protein, DUF1501 family n=1 Tax=Spirosoma fluviale TaxID=1597977 RepID=A0A286FBC5_9BACT|nr:DUF1501 domain-containing protein [Spirosoma fluviale]SOD80502.1 Uncharacterized conserved protein, DUF1501 family [Spirosoma fluviale]